MYILPKLIFEGVEMINIKVTNDGIRNYIIYQLAISLIDVWFDWRSAVLCSYTYGNVMHMIIMKVLYIIRVHKVKVYDRNKCWRRYWRILHVPAHLTRTTGHDF